MDAQTVAAVFGTILLIALPLAVAGVVVEPLRRRMAPLAPVAAACVAVAAMAGSLYFSERAGFVPCELCWYQRIAMYPLAVILPIAAFRRDRNVLGYAAVVAAVGMCVSAYHVYIQAFPEETNFCEILNPCTAKWVEAYGWMTIPTMAGLSFLLILLSIATSFVAARTARTSDESTGRDESDPAPVEVSTDA